MSKAHKIALLLSDLHLTLQQPACRADHDWMDAQKSYLHQVRVKSQSLPILCAGDIFDRWNPSPELIHFAINNLPDRMVCVPGQHDLPSHRIDLMHRSGYGVLAASKKIMDVSGTFLPIGEMIVHGFGWDQPILPVSKHHYMKEFIHVALIHKYCWIAGKNYPGSPDESHLASIGKSLKGYRAAVFGDNHKGFLASADMGRCSVLNCGGFIRRKSDEMDYKPSVGFLYSDGTIKTEPLDTSCDVFQPVANLANVSLLDIKDLVEGLKNLGEHGLDFRESVNQYLKSSEVHPKVKEIILTALETKL